MPRMHDRAVIVLWFAVSAAGCARTSSVLWGIKAASPQILSVSGLVVWNLGPGDGEARGNSIAAQVEPGIAGIKTTSASTGWSRAPARRTIPSGPSGSASTSE